MEVDPEASLQSWPVEVTLGGRDFEIPALPASQWLPLLMSVDTFGILELTGEIEVIEEMILSESVGRDELTEVISSIIQSVSGRSLHVAFTLAYIAKLQWPTVGGYLARSGFRWDVSIGAALDAIYSVTMMHLKPEAVKKIQALLDNEPAVGRKVRPIDRKKAMASFEEMAGPKPGTAPTTGERSGGGPPRTPRRSRRNPRGARQT